MGPRELWVIQSNMNALVITKTEEEGKLAVYVDIFRRGEAIKTVTHTVEQTTRATSGFRRIGKWKDEFSRDLMEFLVNYGAAELYFEAKKIVESQSRG